MYLAASSRHVHRFTNPCCRWCFLGSSNDGGSTSLLACVSAALELDGGRWLRWLQEILRNNLYFSISYGFSAKFSG
jgi:hypothetical protein